MSVDELPSPVVVWAIPERAGHFAHVFRDNANSLAMAYGAQVYLVGSMLYSDEPGDVDLRLLMEHEQLATWFGKDFNGSKERWGTAHRRIEREQLKQSVRLSRRWRSWPTSRFDLQFQSTLFRDDGTPIMREGRPYLRLDDIALNCLAAGRGDP